MKKLLLVIVAVTAVACGSVAEEPFVDEGTIAQVESNDQMDATPYGGTCLYVYYKRDYASCSNPGPWSWVVTQDANISYPNCKTIGVHTICDWYTCRCMPSGGYYVKYSSPCGMKWCCELYAKSYQC